MPAPDTPAPEAFECVGFADFVVDVAGHTLTGAGGRDVPVTRAEFALLLAFLRAPGRVLSRDHLLDAVAGRRSTPFDRGIDVLVSRLRRKIEPDPGSPRLILTLPGVGYKFAGRPRTGVARPEPLIRAAEPQPCSAERRQLTVMLCGFGAAGGAPAPLDPEDRASLLPGYQALCAQVIGRFGGIVAKSVNDGVLGYFGYPEAAEDDAEQAVRAGLALIREVLSLDDRLRARVGIATGLVIVGTPTGDPSGLPVGEAVELANQLLGLAAPDTVVISASCRRLTRGRFDYKLLAMAAGSLPCSEGAFRVTDERSTASRFEALHEGRLTPLIGRTEELDLLLRRWRRAVSGGGQTVMISGEAGIGKSRLVAALREAIAASGGKCERLEWSCSPHHCDSALYPVITRLERAAGFVREDAPEARLAKMEAVLAAGDPTPEELGLIADLLGVPTGGRYPRLDLSPQLRPERTLGALLRRVEVLANARPVLGVLQDAHWADPTTLAGGDAVPQAAFPAAAAIPATLYASLTARLDRLGAIARQVAQTGAAIGREFGHDLLAAIANLADDALGSALRRLEDAALIHRRGIPPEATFSFRHILLRDAAYGMLLREPRRALHARIAEAIVRLRPDVADHEPLLLAWHYTGAGQAELAIGYWQRAGERSVAQFANREAIDYFQRALDLVETLPPGAKRDRLEADLRLALVVPLIAVHGFGSEAVEACAVRAKELEDRLPDWPGAFAAHKVVWNSCLVRQSVRGAVALAHDLMSLAERDGDPARIAIACRALGFSLSQCGERAAADPVLARGVALADGVADTEFAIYGEDPRIICRLFRGLTRCLLGYPGAGLRIAREGLARARARNNPHAIGSLVFLAHVQIFLRNAAAAEQAGAEALEIARQHRFAQWLAWAQEQRGRALCQLGDAGRGLPLLEEAVRQTRETGPFPIPRALYYLAECCFLAGRLEAALDHVETAHRHAEVNGGHYMSAEMHRLHAELLQVRGTLAPEIEGHLHKALNVARSQAARLWELRAATRLAQFWHTHGRAAEAHTLLAPLYASFTEGFDLPDLVEARALLGHAASNPAPSS